MRYREVIIDGRVFLEIVDDEPETEPDRQPGTEEEKPQPKDDRGRGVWIGELVPR